MGADESNSTVLLLSAFSAIFELTDFYYPHCGNIRAVLRHFKVTTAAEIDLTCRQIYYGQDENIIHWKIV